MSGGSFNYLCCKDAEQLLAGGCSSELVEMRDKLREIGAIDAAGQTDAIIATIAEARALVGIRVEALKEIWKAVEWVESLDWGPERIEKALSKFRGKDDPGGKTNA